MGGPEWHGSSWQRGIAESGSSQLSPFMIDVPGYLVWDLPCVQQASYLEWGPLMWMLPLYLHVNQKSDYDIIWWVTLTHFTLMFGISSNIRPTTTKPCIVLHIIALAWQVPWPGDLDLYLTHFTLMFDNSSTMPTSTIPCIVLLLDVLK